MRHLKSPHSHDGKCHASCQVVTLFPLTFTATISSRHIVLFFCQEQLPEASENQAMYSALKECESSNLHSTVTYSLAKIVSHSNDSDASNVPEKRKQGPSRHCTRTKIVVPVGWATSPTGQLDTVPLRLRLPWNP